MAFDSVGAGFSRGFRGGRAIKQNKIALRQQKEQKEAEARRQASERLRQRFSDAREQSLAGFREFVTLAGKAAEGGAPPDSDVIKQARVGAIASLGSFASLAQDLKARAIESGAGEEELGQLPDASAFVKNNLPLFDVAVGVGAETAQEQQVQTLSPEDVAELGFTPGSIVQKKPDGTLSLTFEPPSADDDVSTLQERVELLVQSGVDTPRAQGIAAGRFDMSMDPITRERKVIDLATGEVVGETVKPPPEGEVPGMIPENIDTAAATGAPGALKNFSNIIKDAVGAGTAYPKAQEATEALTSIQTFTSITLQAEVPGRPSNFLMEKIDGLTVTPNSLFQGEERAKTRLTQTRRLIDGEIQRIELDVLPLDLPPDKRVETQLNLTQLKRLRDAYDGLLEPFETIEVPEGIPDEVKDLWEFMTPAQRREFLPDASKTADE